MKPILRSWLFLLLVLALAGCQTPNTVDGRKVIGSRWINGRLVYFVEPSAQDLADFQKQLKESEEAGRKTTFQPKDNPK